MTNRVFFKQDERQFSLRGIPPEVILSQIEQFTEGIPFARLERPCTKGDGLFVLSDEEIALCESAFQPALYSGRIEKFVPASGAASRMFKDLLTCYENLLQQDGDAADNDAMDSLEKFVDHLPQFAFYPAFHAALKKNGHDPVATIETRNYPRILTILLDKEGLNFRNLPKGMIPFHRYGKDKMRNPFEEHLCEALEYACDLQGTLRVHFTVPAFHLKAIRKCIDDFAAQFFDIAFKINYSIQKPSTDTIAVDMENRPFRNPDGSLLFRPGGHGALLENLNELKGDIVFIKNVDNVVPDHLKGDTYRYKRALGGYLIRFQEQCFAYLRQLESGDLNAPLLQELTGFIEKYLYVRLPEPLQAASSKEKCDFLFRLLNKPIRVCGMVKNEGETGGGPFWIRDSHGNSSLQIVEASQVDPHNQEHQDIWKSSTHFNPVDLVCGVRDYRGEPFHLPQFADPTAGFISHKSRNGRKLKALELPGLWNGAMAYWNSLFVEVPASTFSPVKNIFDLLGDAHQPAK